MPEISGPTTQRPRLFDRGFLLSSIAALFLGACSGSLNTPDQPGTGGSNGGTGECGLGAGNCTGAAGTGGDAGRGGTGGDIGGTGGGDVGGTGGTSPLPSCRAGSPVFSVCIVNDMDPVPIPQPPAYVVTNGALAATIVDVGTGTPPAGCESGRVLGSGAQSTWWLQARTADGRLWTIGFNGLSLTPIVGKDDSISLNVSWWPEAAGGFGPAFGHVEMLDSAGTPLLWVSSGAPAALSTSWFTLAPGNLVCAPTAPCDIGGHDVIATVDGHVQTLPPFGGAILGRYYVVIGQYIEMVRPPNCADYFGQLFDAAVVKLPMSTGP